MTDYSLRKIKEDNDAIYGNVDFQILPECMLRLYLSDDFKSIERLADIAYAMPFYEEFKRTHLQRTARNIELNNALDLMAYMQANSSFTFDMREELGLIAVSRLNYFNSLDGQALILLNEYQRKQEKLLIQHESIIDYLKDQIDEHLKTIKEFIRTNEEELQKPQGFIDSSYAFVLTRPIRYFDQMPIIERYEIASGKWRTLDIGSKRQSYHLFLTLFYKDIRLPSFLTKTHPYLLAMNGTIEEIVKDICNHSPIQSILEIFCKNICSVSKLRFSNEELISKCQEKLRMTRIILNPY